MGFDLVKLFQVILAQILCCYTCQCLANYTIQTDNLNSNHNLRITGGRLARENEFPYQVPLYLNTGGSFSFFCGGSIYNSRFIVTAGHCLQILQKGENREPEDLRISVGNLEIPPTIPGNQEFAQGLLRVRRVHVHPQFSFGGSTRNGVNSRLFWKLPKNDIGLLELENDILFTNSVRAINIARRNEVSSGMADASGWGKTGIQLAPSLNEPKIDLIPLKTVQLDIYPRIICAARYGTTVPESTLCVGTLLMWNSSTCYGDSGGPVVCRRGSTGDPYLCGIVSNGKGCGLLLTPEFATDVGRFFDYIIGIAGSQ